MPSFGENLRREREKRNVTLEQISQSTKIGTRMLQALEDNKFSQLPGGIFNKGFVRAYARTLGIDEEQTIHDYLEASGEAPPVMPEMEQERPAPKVVPEPEAPHRPLPWGMFAALLLLAALALSLWSHRQKKESESAACVRRLREENKKNPGKFLSIPGFLIRRTDRGRRAQLKAGADRR